MKKWFFIIISIVILIFIGFFIFKTNSQNSNDYYSNYTAEKTSTFNESESKDDSSYNNISNNEISTSSDKSSYKNDTETIAKFSTKLPNDTKERYSNIKLACKTLDGTIVKSGDTFSLWNTLGCPNKEKGYKKAKAFTSDGDIKQSYGGGICQVITTIYNALLKIDEIKITERHEHSRDVVYIKDGKDAAVSYKSADLKFKNNADYDIKLKASVKNNKVIIKIEKL